LQIRATLLPSELREAALISRPGRFWLRFFAANWYATVICLLVAGIAINGLINHEKLHWGPLAGVFAFGAFFIWLPWFRWNSALEKAANAASAKSGTVSLETDGVRSTFANGGSSFVPWFSFSTWKEGKNIFLLSGENTAILPIDAGTRDSIRALLMSHIS
jgi:hypothetical protein